MEKNQNQSKKSMKDIFKKKQKSSKIDVKTDKKAKFRMIFSIGFFVFLLISLFRVPLIGEFFDAIFFAFFFGWAKYIVYGYSLTLIILFWCKKLNKKMYSKKAITLTLTSCFLVGCLFSSIYFNFVHQTTGLAIYKDYFGYWWASVFPSNLSNFNSFIYQDKIYIDGGIIGVTVNYLSNFIVLILSIIGLIIIYLALATKQREKLLSFFKKKVGTAKIEKIINEVNEGVQGNTTNNNDTKVDYITDDTYLNSILADPKKNHLSLNSSNANRNFDTEKLKENILAFFMKNQLSFIKTSVNNNNPQSFIIDFLIDDDTYASFRNLKNEFREAIGNLDYNIAYEAHTLSIIFNRQVMLSNALMMKNLQIELKSPFEVAFIDYNNVPLVINLRKNPLIGVFDASNHFFFNYLVF